MIYLAFDRLGRRLRGLPLDTPLRPVPTADAVYNIESAMRTDVVLAIE